MKVNWYNATSPNIDYANRPKQNNLSGLNQCCTDTFQKRNVSFGSGNSFTPEEQQIINKENKNSMRSRLLELKRLGLSITDAIACLDLDDVNVERFKKLTQNDKNLATSDKISIIALDIDDALINRFKEIKKSKKLEHYEVGFATKLNLSDSQIDTYLDKKRQVLKYTDSEFGEKEWMPTVDELMRLVREGFDDEQLKRFAKLRNTKINLEDFTVRRKGGEQYYPFEYLVKAIKSGAADEDIKKTARLIELGDYEFTLDSQAEILCLSDENFDRFKNRIKDVENVQDTLALTELTDEQYLKINGLLKKGLPVQFVKEVASLSDEQRVKYQNLVNKGVFEPIASMVATLSTTQHERYKNLVNNGMDENFALEMAKLTDKEYAEYKELVKNGEDKCDAVELAKLTDKQRTKYNNAKSMLSEIDAIYTLNIAQLTDEQEKIFNQRIKKGLNVDYALKLALLSEKQRIRYQDLIKNGEGDYEALQLSGLTDQQYKRYKMLVNNGMSDVELLHMFDFSLAEDDKFVDPIDLSDDQFSRFDEQLNLGLSVEQAVNVALLTDEQYAKYVHHINSGKDYFESLNLAKLTDKQIKRYKNLRNNGVYDFVAFPIAKLSDEQYEKYKKTPIRLSIPQAIKLAKTTNLTSVTPEIIENLSDNFWYETMMGTSKENNDAIRTAITLALEFRANSDKDTGLEVIDAQKLKKCLGNSDYTYNNGELKFLKEDGVDVKIAQKFVKNKPCLFIDDKNSENKYIAYNGAIAKVKPLSKRDSKQFESWGNLLTAKQAPILAEAADAFVFNLFDESGNCVIGQNSHAFDMSEKNDIDIKNIYSDKLMNLKKNNELTAQNILKLMPQNCMLTISPYISVGKILYSIVGEWFSKDNNRWQLEVHSQDIDYNNGDEWIFRLHKNNKDNQRQYFRFTDTKEGYDFNGGYFDENAHLKCPSPLDKSDLLNNVAFQKVMKQVSSYLIQNDKVSKIAKDLKVDYVNNDMSASMDNIVKHCIKSHKDLIKYQKEYNKFRENLGMPKVYTIGINKDKETLGLLYA